MDIIKLNSKSSSMVNTKDPFEGNKDESKIRKLPEFVYIDKDKPQTENIDLGSSEFSQEKQQDPQQMLGSIHSMSQGRQPFYLRLVAFFGSGIIFALSFVVLILTLICFVISLSVFRQSDLINNQASMAWSFYKKTLVFALGAFVMTFNLSFGVAIILVYLMLKGEKFSSNFYDKFKQYEPKE